MSTDSPGGVHRTFVSGGVILLVLLSGVSLYRLERLTRLTAPQSHQKGSEGPSTQPEKVKLPDGLSWRREYVPLSDGAAEGAEQPPPADIRVRLRNLDEKSPLYIRRVDLYSASGQKLKSFGDEPFLIKGFALSEFLIKAGATAPPDAKALDDEKESQKESDARLSHLLIEWAHKGRAQAPLIEAETLDSRGHVMHVREGRPLRAPRPERKERMETQLAPYPEPPFSQAPPRPQSGTRSYELVRPKPAQTLHPKGL